MCAGCLSDFLRLLRVIPVQVIIFDQLDQPVGVGSVCCVSAFLQTSCPTFIVGYFQFEQRGITGTVDQKTGVVFVRLFRILIFAETFSAQVIVVIDTPTPPVGMTFDAEVVVRFACQLLRPAPDSNNPCASVILAGIRYFF